MYEGKVSKLPEGDNYNTAEHEHPFTHVYGTRKRSKNEDKQEIDKC